MRIARNGQCNAYFVFWHLCAKVRVDREALSVASRGFLLHSDFFLSPCSATDRDYPIASLWQCTPYGKLVLKTKVMESGQEMAFFVGAAAGSRRPFSRHAAHLVANNYDPPKAWNDRIDAGPPFIRSACPPPSPSLPPGADLPRKQWVRLNRLRSGTARVGETLQLWGMQEAASCPCSHPTQTVEHVVTDCVLLKSPGDLTALRCPNAETRSWLSELPIELWTLIFDYLVVVWQTLIIYI